MSVCPLCLMFCKLGWISGAGKAALVHCKNRVLQSGALLLGRKLDLTKVLLPRHQGAHVNIYGRTDMTVAMAMVMINPHHMCAFTAGRTCKSCDDGDDESPPKLQQACMTCHAWAVGCSP